jgi:UDP-N-acetylglucosamine 1-carboxyvinyltransferase
MAACLADGETILRNAAREPEIVALAETLKKMGAQIEGEGSSVIKITGSKSLNPVSTSIIPDRIEAGTFMVAAALTGGDVRLLNCEPEHMGGIINKLKMTGACVEKGKDFIRVQGGKEIQSIDIRTLPYPGFPTDMQAQFMTLMAVAGGTSVITETIFENRFIHVQELKRMGADITLSGVTTATVKGVAGLSGAQVMASDLRASASLILAGLIASGTTEVNRVYHLDRGYEKIEEKFLKLGADIKRAKGI